MAVQYSIQKMVSDGTLSTIALGIQYLQRNDIYIRIAGDETPQSGAPSGYTWSFIDNTTLKILPVVPNGVEVVVYRRTDTDAMYNIYSQNAQFDEATVDENNQQLLYIAQEYLEQGIPGTGVESLEYINTVGGINYYKFKLTDGSYTLPFGVPDGTDVLRSDLATTGTTLVAHKGRTNENTITLAADINSGMVNVFHYLNDAERAAVTSGSYGPIATVSHAIDAAIADIGSGIYPVDAKGLWFPNGAWIIDKPIRSKIPLKIDGDSARLIASPAFVGSTLNDGVSTVVIKAMMVFVPDDNYNTISGPQAQGMSVGRGITLHGGDVVDAGVYTERMTYASYNMRVDYADTPIIVGPYSWGLNLDDVILENFDTHGIHFKTNAAANGCSISTPRIWGRFKNPLSALFFDTNSECNGVHVSGGFLEKVGYAGLHAAGSGSCHYDAVDMEQCANTTIRVVGNNPNSVPVTISGGCFLDSPVIRVYVDNATVEISGSRLYGENGGLDFSTTNTGKVVAKNNKYYQGAYTFSIGSRIIYEDAVSVSDDRIAILPSSSASVTVTGHNEHRNNAASPALATSTINRLHSQLTSSNSESAIDIYAASITAGVQSRIAGLRFSTLGGVNAVHPFLDNTTSIGLPSARCSVVYSAAGVQTTSDATHKEHVRDITDSERLVGADIRTKIKTYNMVGGSKRTIGVLAQDICAVFEKHGLDWRDYDVVHYDTWTTEDGAAHSIYSVKYDQLWAFVLASM